jgi:hypothetical protein
MRRITFIIVGVALLIGGGLAASGVDATALTVILPAIPLALLSTWLDPSARSGLLWDSAHSPPFLNPLGIGMVYFLPGVIFVVLGLIRRANRTAIRPRERISEPTRRG